MLFTKKNVPKNEYHRTVIWGGKTFLFRGLWKDVPVVWAKEIARIIVDYSKKRSDLTLELVEQVAKVGDYTMVEFVTRTLEADPIELFLAWPDKEEPE